MKATMTQVFIPIVIYRLPGDKKWTAEALGLEGAVTDGKTKAEAKSNLVSVLQHYIAMLDPEDPIQAAELDYLGRLTAPPEGVDWINLPLTANGNKNDVGRQALDTIQRAHKTKRQEATTVK